MKKFFAGMMKGFETYGLVAGGAIGGMVFMKGVIDGTTTGIMAGACCIVVNMLVCGLINK